MKPTQFISKVFDKNNSATPIALAALAGVAIGAVVAVLFAPASGKIVRHTIVDRAKGLLGLRDKEKENGISEPTSDEPKLAHKNIKKPKSDIKALTNEARSGEQPDETTV